MEIRPQEELREFYQRSVKNLHKLRRGFCLKRVFKRLIGL